MAERNIYSRTLPGRGSQSLLEQLKLPMTGGSSSADPATHRAEHPAEDLPAIDPEFDADEYCRALRPVTVRAGPEKTSRKLLEASLQPGDIVKILQARAFADGSVRLEVEDEQGKLLGWISCFDAKNDPLLENVDSDKYSFLESSNLTQGGDPSPEEVAQMAARFASKQKQKSKPQQRWDLVRGTVNTLSAFGAILEPMQEKSEGSACGGGGGGGGRRGGGGGGGEALLTTHTGTPPKELRDAVRRGDVDIVRGHVQNGEFANSISNKKLGSTLLYSAAQNGHLEIVDHLIAEGADVNKRTLKGATALYTAAFNGDCNMVEKLLNYGASPVVQKNDGWTALRAARHRGKTDVVELLERWQREGLHACSESQQTRRDYKATPRSLDPSASNLPSPSNGGSSLTFSQSPKPMSPDEQKRLYIQQQQQQQEQHNPDELQLGSESPIVGGEMDSLLGTPTQQLMIDDTTRIAQLAEVQSHIAAAAAISAQLASTTDTGGSAFGASASVGAPRGFQTPTMPARRPRRVQEVSSFDIRVGPSTISRSKDPIVRDVMAVEISTSAPVEDSVCPAQADQVVSIANIRSWELPPRKARETAWKKDHEDAIAKKRAPGNLLEKSSMLGTSLSGVWGDSDGSNREIAKKRYEAKEAEACVNDFIADLFSETLPSTPLSTTPPKETRPPWMCFCRSCGKHDTVSELSSANLAGLSPAYECGRRATLSIRRYLRGGTGVNCPKVDDAVHQGGFLSDFVFTSSAPLQTSKSGPNKPDAPRKASRSKKAADAETACNDISATARWDDLHGDSLALSEIDSPDTYKYYNRQRQTMESTDLRGKHHLMLNRLRAERGETMHPMVVTDEHGVETESQKLLRQKAEEAEKRRTEAERVATRAEEQRCAEQAAAAKAEEEAAALRDAEAEAARKTADAEAVLAETALMAARQRKELVATRSRMVEAELKEQSLRDKKAQAEVDYSRAEQAVTHARSADRQVQSQLSTSPARKRVARTPGAKAHGALSTHLSPQDLGDADKITPHLEAHVKQMELWQAEIKGETENAVDQVTATLPLQKPDPKGVADEIKSRMDKSFSEHAAQDPPYTPLHPEPEPEPEPSSLRQILVTVEVPPNSSIDESLFNDAEGTSMRVLHVEENLGPNSNVPEGIPPRIVSPGAYKDAPLQAFASSTPPTLASVTIGPAGPNQTGARSPPGGVSYYTQSTPPQQLDHELPPASPTAALNAYQRRCGCPAILTVQTYPLARLNVIALCGGRRVLRNLRALCGPQSQRPQPGLQTVGDSWGPPSPEHPAGGGRGVEHTDDFRVRYLHYFGADDLDPMLLADTFPASGGDTHELLHLYGLKVERAHPTP